MIVVADSGPLHYLILLDYIDLLEVSTAGSSYQRPCELSAAGAPPTMRDWILRPLSWVTVVPVALEAVETITDDLDLGERSAISLATTRGADLLLIDEAAGRAEARRRNLRVTGTLGVLRAGAEQGLVNVPALIGRLKTTSFYVDDALVNAIFQRWLKA